MTLKDLLLQFAGENEIALNLDELLSSKVAGIEIEKDLPNSVKILVENPDELQSIKFKIKEVLDEAQYESYKIIPKSDGEIQHIIVEVE